MATSTSFLRRATAPIYTSGQLYSANMHRMDIIMSNNRVLGLPLSDHSKGSDVIRYIQKHGLEHFVVCRNSVQQGGFYEVLYTTDDKPEIKGLVTLSKPFQETAISTLFVPNRTILTKHQRMPFFVFEIEEFLRMLAVRKCDFKMNQFSKRSSSVLIKVLLPTGLVLTVKIRPQKKIRSIADKLYKEMDSLYLDLKDKSCYRFCTMLKKVASEKATFESDPEMMAALRRQKLNPASPQFCYIEVFGSSEFDKVVEQYRRELDLALVDCEETRALNASLSTVRKEAEQTRRQRLEEDPLRARMRMSDSDPPLTTYLQKINQDDPMSGQIAMKVERDVKEMGASGISMRIRYDAPANEAIAAVIQKFQRRVVTKLVAKDDEDSQTLSVSDPTDVSEGARAADARRSTALPGSSPLRLSRSGLSASSDNAAAIRDQVMAEEEGEKDPNDYVLVLRGMDEILAGNTPLCNFVCVRQFLLSSQRLLNLTLAHKQSVIEDIRNKEMSTKVDIKEPEAASLSRPIRPRDTSAVSFDVMPAYPHSFAQEHLSIFVKGCIAVPDMKKPRKYCLTVCLINGDKLLSKPAETRSVFGYSTLLFNELLTLNLPIASLPRTARIAFTLYNCGKVTQKKMKKKAVGTYNFAVFRHDGWMNTGEYAKKMWGHGMDYFLTTCESNEDNPVILLFDFPQFRFPVAFVPTPKNTDVAEIIRKSVSIPQKDSEIIARLRNMDPLETMTEEDKQVLMKHRFLVMQYPELLPMILSAIDYSILDQVSEIPSLLANWAKPSPTQALTLLDAKFADYDIRNYAVERLEEFGSNEIMLYLLQLVQALKYELYDDSPLARFLVRRGLDEPKFLGHQLFWQLMSEAHLSHIRPRFSAILVNFMYGIGSYREELLKGYKFTQQLVELNSQLSKLDYATATTQFREALTKVEIPKEFHLPMDPRLVVDSFIVEKCRVMNSKKKPLWLAFRNSSIFVEEPVLTMFKVGDDLRQDQLTLQVMRVMEHLWRQNGTDFHMRCYGVLPTGLNQGFVEVVPNSVTESELQKERGTLAGVLAKDIITKYLSKYNNEKGLINAREIFRLSSAGYAIATSVLGVADRHPGNIMVQQDGHFFHIDFGHFLGNWKYKLGVKREGDLFHFSEACANAIGEKDGPELARFEEDCWNALSILRNNSKLLISLFLLMLGTGIPELTKPQDVEFLKKKLYLGISDEQARIELAQLIKDSMESTRTKLNNLCHNLRTG